MKSDLTAVIPAFNASDTIEVAVRSALRIPGVKVIVVDDGSVDATGEIARGSGASVVFQENQGTAEARKTGLSKVETEFVVFLDADDELLETGTTQSLGLLRRSPQASGAIGAYMEVNGQDERPVVPWPEGVNQISLLNRGRAPGPPAAIVWRTSAMKTLTQDPVVQPLEPQWAEDYETIIQGSLVGPILAHRSFSCRYSALGGKSSNAPLNCLQESENIRRYYGRATGHEIEERSHRDLVALARARPFFSTKSIPLRLVIATSAFWASPSFWIKKLIAKARRYNRD